jgi:hypothetical protein
LLVQLLVLLAFFFILFVFGHLGFDFKMAANCTFLDDGIERILQELKSDVATNVVTPDSPGPRDVSAIQLDFTPVKCVLDEPSILNPFDACTPAKILESPSSDPLESTILNPFHDDYLDSRLGTPIENVVKIMNGLFTGGNSFTSQHPHQKYDTPLLDFINTENKDIVSNFVYFF